MPLQYTWRTSKFFIFFIKVRAVDIVTLGTDFLKKKNILDFDSVRTRRQRLLRKRHVKSDSRYFKLHRAHSDAFNWSNVGKSLWNWILRNCIKVQENKKESCCLVFPSSTKREFRYFHVVLVQRRQRNVQKSVMHVQSCCLADLNPLLFCSSCCCRRRRCLSSLMRGMPTGKVVILLLQPWCD